MRYLFIVYYFANYSLIDVFGEHTYHGKKNKKLMILFKGLCQKKLNKLFVTTFTDTHY